MLVAAYMGQLGHISILIRYLAVQRNSSSCHKSQLINYHERNRLEILFTAIAKTQKDATGKRLRSKKMKPEETWIGIGAKSGGMLGIGGYESTQGKFFNVGNPTITYDFTVSSSRWGLGLGGSGGGMVIIFVFKLNGLYWLNQRSVKDWGVNISIGENYGEILEFLAKMRFFSKVKLIGKTLTHLITHIDDLRNIASFLYNASDFDMKGDHPMLAFDVPLVGEGLEVSAFKSYGKIYISG
jgi:hypothetical protein